VFDKEIRHLTAQPESADSLEHYITWRSRKHPNAGKQEIRLKEAEKNLMALDFYDYVTFIALAIILIGFTVLFIWTISLPGKIAIQRKHPHAEAVRLMGNLGFLGAVPWVHALMWAIHDSVTVDVRRFPEEEREHIREEMEKLDGKPKQGEPHHFRAEAGRLIHKPKGAGVPKTDTGAPSSDKPNPDSPT
jgi:hypothetical protein